nr:TraR/DksA C4-type zinc finger protein [Thiocystis violacea]
MERELQIRIAAIQRRANDGLGRSCCVDCGEPIPENRRRHVPNAVRCSVCQQKLEHHRDPVRRSAA